MSAFQIDIEKSIAASEDIVDVARRLGGYRVSLNAIRLGMLLQRPHGGDIDRALRNITDNILEEAAQMKSLGRALQTIASKYRNAEEWILLFNTQQEITRKTLELGSFSEKTGTDKRKWYQKFWDWITQQEPDEYDTTTLEQEKAADARMKNELWMVLQDEKYSRQNWNNASVEERKQILQDYMEEVIKIYGLQDVNHKIKWDKTLTYTPERITWGQYSHGMFNHRVTLNESALADNVGGWESYDLLETVSHELRHAYQHEAVDHPSKYMVSQETINTWRDNFNNYISSNTDHQRYLDQPVEVDARDFQIRRNEKPN